MINKYFYLIVPLLLTCQISFSQVQDDRYLRICFYSENIHIDSVRVLCSVEWPSKKGSKGVVSVRFIEYKDGKKSSSYFPYPKAYSEVAKDELYLKFIPLAYFKAAKFAEEKKLNTDVEWLFPFTILPSPQEE